MERASLTLVATPTTSNPTSVSTSSIDHAIKTSSSTIKTFQRLFSIYTSHRSPSLLRLVKTWRRMRFQKTCAGLTSGGFSGGGALTLPAKGLVSKGAHPSLAAQASVGEARAFAAPQLKRQRAENPRSGSPPARRTSQCEDP